MLPAEILQRLPPALLTRFDGGPEEHTLSTGHPQLDDTLPSGGLLRGAVTELAVTAGAALGTRIALGAVASAQRLGLAQGGQAPWCAFVDPTGALYAPGALAAGVQLERLLVVRPPVDSLGRIAARLAESKAFAVLVVDALGSPGAPIDLSLARWPRVVRRLAQAATESSTAVLLLTHQGSPRPLPLPVAQRLELTRTAPGRLLVRVAKERRGRISAARSIDWAEHGFLPGPARATASRLRLTG